MWSFASDLCARTLEIRTARNTEIELLDKLIYEARVDGDVGSALHVAAGRMWPQIPHDVRSAVAAWPEQSHETSVWNRRLRRKIKKAGKVVLNLFAGESRRLRMP